MKFMISGYPWNLWISTSLGSLDYSVAYYLLLWYIHYTAMDLGNNYLAGRGYDDGRSRLLLQRLGAQARAKPPALDRLSN